VLEHLANLYRSELAIRQNAVTDFVENQNFFPTIYFKDQERRRKQAFFLESNFKATVVVTSAGNFENVSPELNQENFKKITEQQFLDLTANESQARKILEGSLVILTNNNVAKITPGTMAERIGLLPNTLFVIHDFDNHHWHEHSMQCALLADVYVPAHLTDYSILSRINPTLVAPIPSGSTQWTKDFLRRYFAEAFGNKRYPSPLGMHYHYPKFRYRNSVLSTLSSKIASVGWVSKDFHLKSAHERWREWISYPLHWVVPVFNDLPLRFFDSLISGGMPLVPTSLKPYLSILKIPNEFYLCYSPSDLINPEKFLDYALTVFNDLGFQSRRIRHEYAMDKFHVDATISRLVSCAKKEYSEQKP
jgi:hypothetical protein